MNKSRAREAFAAILRIEKIVGGTGQQSRLDGGRYPQGDDQHHDGREQALDQVAQRHFTCAELPGDVVHFIQNEGQDPGDPQRHAQPGQP